MKNVLKNFLMFGVMGLMSACSSLYDEQKNNEQSVAQLSKTQIYEDIIVGSKDVIAPRSGENEIYDIFHKNAGVGKSIEKFCYSKKFGRFLDRFLWQSSRRGPVRHSL